MQDISVFLANHAWLSTSIGILIVILMIIEIIRLKRQHTRLTANQLTQLVNKNNAVLVDIRTNDLYRQGHIIHAISIPMAEIRQQSKKLEKHKSKPLVLICGNGLESQKIAASLKKQGYNTYSLASGMRTWAEAGLPIIKE